MILDESTLACTTECTTVEELLINQLETVMEEVPLVRPGIIVYHLVVIDCCQEFLNQVRWPKTGMCLVS